MGQIDQNVEVGKIEGNMKSKEMRYVMAERTSTNEFTFNIEVTGKGDEIPYDF